MSQRVLYIIGSQERRGAQRQLALLARRLPRREFETHVCLLGSRGGNDDWLEHDTEQVHRIERRWHWDVRTYRALGRLIRRLRPSIVQSWLFEANSYGRVAASRAGVSAIVAVERYLDRRRPASEWRVDRWLASRTSCLVANSNDVLQFHLDHDVLPQQTAVIPDGVERPSAPPISRQQLLGMLRITPPARLIMTAGSLLPENRFKDLIWSADILKIIRRDVHLVILGDGRHRGRLERYQKNVGIEDHVHFVGWRDDARALLSLADVFWLAGDQQGAPAALLEAMAAGVPVVATDTASHRAIVEPEKNGFLVPVGDRAALAKYANRLLDQPDLARSLGQSGARDVQERFSAAAMVDRYCELYRRLLSSRALAADVAMDR